MTELPNCLIVSEKNLRRATAFKFAPSQYKFRNPRLFPLLEFPPHYVHPSLRFARPQCSASLYEADSPAVLLPAVLPNASRRSQAARRAVRQIDNREMARRRR
jgi:hypothetical protein